MQIRKQIKEMLVLIDRHEWVAQLLVRLFVGYFFMETGWGKLHNLDGFARRFAGWGIPYPYFNAALSAYTEFIGGLLDYMRYRNTPGFNTDDNQHAGSAPQSKFETRDQPRRFC